MNVYEHVREGSVLWKECGKGVPNEMMPKFSSSRKGNLKSGIELNEQCFRTICPD